MTKVVYTYTTPYGKTVPTKFKTLAEVTALVEAKGGHYKAEYIPIPRPTQTVTAKRRAAYILKYGTVFA
jgi:hypothetical protein